MRRGRLEEGSVHKEDDEEKDSRFLSGLLKKPFMPALMQSFFVDSWQSALSATIGSTTGDLRLFSSMRSRFVASTPSQIGMSIAQVSSHELEDGNRQAYDDRRAQR